MTAITFDTLDAARTLRTAGVDEKTAETIVAVVQRTIELPSIEHLATKDQVETLGLVTRSQIEGLDKRLVQLQGVVFASIGFNLAGFLGIAAFLYTVLKH